MALALGCGNATESDATGDLGGTAADDGNDGSGNGNENSSGDGTDEGSGDGDTGPWEPVDEDEGTPASGIQISRVEANQGTAVTIAGPGGELVDPAVRNAPLITGRGTLVRVYWELEAGFARRAIECRLALYDELGTQLRVLYDELEVDGPPEPLFAAGSFHFVLDSALLVPGMSYSVGLFEVEAQGQGPAVPQRVPATGQADLGLASDAMEMRLVLVPIEVAGAAPDMERFAPKIEEELFQVNPLQRIDLTVAPMQSWPTKLQAVGEAIEVVSALREADAAPSNAYYHGVVGPGCCAEGVGGGYGFVADATPESASSRISIAKIPDGNDPVLIHAHELGHNQGLDHAPCGGASGPHIPDYPYPECHLGAQGYGVIDGALRLEEYSYDYMAYAIGNQWTSDFTYALNFERIRILTSWDDGAAAPSPSGRTLNGLLRRDGSIGWWITSGAPPVSGPRAHTATFERFGEVVATLPVVERTAPDAGVRAVAVTLPDELESDSFTVTLGGKEHRVDMLRDVDRIYSLLRR